MVFNKELDKSLWSILETESDLRNDIITFLKNIPDNLLEEIQRELSSKQLHDFNKEFIAEDGSVFLYECSIDEEEIIFEIKHCLAEPKDKNTPYMNLGTSLTLVRNFLEEKELNQWSWIGNFCFDNDFSSHFKNLPFVQKNCLSALNISNSKITGVSYVREQEYEYYLIPIENGAYVQKVCTYNGQKTTSEIDLEEMPEELTLEYVYTEYDGDNPKRNLSF